MSDPLQKTSARPDLSELEIAVSTLRPEVLAFAFIMEKQMRAHDAKHNFDNAWLEKSPFDLFIRIFDECAELGRALNTPMYLGVDGEAADVANFAMMVADNVGLLDTKRAARLLGVDLRASARAEERRADNA